MWRIFRLSLAICVAVACTTTAEAGLLTSVSSANNSIAVVNSFSGITHTAGSVNNGTVTIDLEVFQLNTPVALNFTFGAGGADTLTDYAVTLNVKNSVSPPGQSDNFAGFDVVRNVNAGGAVVSSGLRPNVSPTSNVFWVDYSGGFNITNGFRWGGLSGGGARLAAGATAVNTFVYRVTFDGSTGGGTSALTFTANPEPTALLLGSLVMVPAAVVARRRRKAAAEAVEA